MHWRPAADFTVTGKAAGPRLERGKKKGKNWWKVPTTTLDEAERRNTDIRFLPKRGFSF